MVETPKFKGSSKTEISGMGRLCGGETHTQTHSSREIERDQTGDLRQAGRKKTTYIYSYIIFVLFYVLSLDWQSNSFKKTNGLKNKNNIKINKK